MRVLVTGAAGFIGSYVAKALLARGEEVLGLDDLDPYYDPALKRARLRALEASSRFRFAEVDIRQREALDAAWRSFDPEAVIHLAAQAGVRHSILHPLPFVETNLLGFQHVLEAVRREREARGRTVPFIYASSSSVYGGSTDLPFRESQDVRSPISLYAATKLANEVVAGTYVRLFDLVTVGLRFFTVYGPFGRPDMAVWSFAEKILRGEPLPIFNRGDMVRDWTYVDDIVQGTIAALDRPRAGRVYNLGRGQPVDLLAMVGHLERGLGRKATLDLLPMQPGDVHQTLADISLAREELGYDPKVTLADGVARFAEWFLAWREGQGAARAAPGSA